MEEAMIRKYKEADREILKEITAICFNGVCIDQNIEKQLGVIAEKDWAWRKKRHIDKDIAANSNGTFVAEVNEKVVGYITTRVDHGSKIGSIPNIGVLPAFQKGGIGRKLMDIALDYLQNEGMLYVRIETLDQNVIGQRFYPSYGFKEVAKQIHYIMPISST